METISPANDPEMSLDERVRLAYREGIAFTKINLSDESSSQKLAPLFKRYGLLSVEGKDKFIEYSQAQALELKKAHPDALNIWTYLTVVLPRLVQTEAFRKDPVWFLKAIAKRIIQK